MVSTATLNLTPWAAQALSLAEERDLARRAVELRCRVAVNGASPHGSWLLHITSWATEPITGPVHVLTKRDMRGHLADCMSNALDEYARLFAYTPEELVTIAAQSGVAVSRA